MGRPSRFSQEIANAICEQIAGGKSLRSICKEEDAPAASTVFKWLAENEAFSEQYTRARQAQADALADETLDIADGSDGNDPARDRLRWDARRWYASKLAPKKYGDKIEAALTGPNGGALEVKVTFG